MAHSPGPETAGWTSREHRRRPDSSRTCSRSRVSTRPGERVEAVFEAIDRLSGADLAGIALTRPDDDRHDALVAELEARAAERGRTPLVEEAREAVRNGVAVRIASEWPAGT